MPFGELARCVTLLWLAGIGLRLTVLVGEILPAALTIPLVLPLVAGSWRLDFAAWAVPTALIALAVAALAPRPADATGSGTATARWWPDWRDPLIWRLGLMLGTITS